ncbi:hypothetical protein E4T56_gene11596 [Termitomyces sp. T112]|nr:hypothetical protein E4T56_gene11596 [Termitomyces sp. T112]
MTLEPILLFLDNKSSFWMEANISNFATGAILSQQSLEDGKWHLVAFYSKSLNAVEQNCEIHNKKMLAIIWSFEEWQHFLEAKKLNCQQAQWSIYLANFDFSLHHKPGQSMGKPDALFWRVDYGMGWGGEDNSLAIEGAEVDILQDIWQGNQDGKQEELVVQAAQVLKLGCTTSAKLVHVDKWALWDGILTFRDCISVPNILELC